ncbi:peptide-methionine (S)-S-oxide reductase MsrA [Solitalea lacus]|uniref:peptide-methionine (S)-S-oxide reductase MsrA n=1 Tax=Solitalea lacus TaxID=2911172 RepID=UPI001EDAA8E9|nr:peptide-methionine (S)-S-oxide reductase MsrA [Solitalea lacus]UKJ05930.1 peptide-methionine (S)-S-oxide reductase MsrA [Solitalea lacus]
MKDLIMQAGEKSFLSLMLIVFCVTACAQKPEERKIKPLQVNNVSKQMGNNNIIDTVTFGAGCFWCVEAVFQQLKGVKSVESGYSGGQTDNPTYKEICTGETGHAEVAQIVYDPKVISFGELLEAFWSSHDPTTLNRQGADQGTQYRSVIFYHNNEQKELAEQYKKELDASGAFKNPIVTEIAPFSKFYKAEAYHQNYYNLNGDAPYCQFVIAPKLEKFKRVFKDKLKE